MSTTRPWGGRSISGAVALALVAALLAGCGNRRPHSEVVAAATGDPGGGAVSEGGPVDGVDPTGEGGTIGGDLAGPGGSSGPGGASGQPGRGATPGRPGGGSGTTTPAKSTVRIGLVGTLSGPAGASLKPQADGVRVWVRWVNDRGGVNGHPVELVVGDDAGDPSRHRSLVQEFVEQRKVIAFVGNPEALTGPGSVEYLTAAGVPVIGSEGAGDWFYRSPVYFPQGSHGTALLQAGALSVATIAKQRQVRRIGLIDCIEVQICRDSAAKAPAYYRKHGLEVVFQAQASLGQPDFTAECLSAAQNDVELLVMGMDANSVRNIAQACTRQGFRPVFSWPGAAAAPAQRNDPNLEGGFVTSIVAPWSASGTASTKEFQDAMARYAPGTEVTGGHMLGWVSAKLFQLGAARLPQPPTPAALLDGLASVGDDPLPDLAGTFRFQRGKPASPTVCGFAVLVTNKRFVAADNGARSCAPFEAG